jgi:rubrerythrin
MTKKIFQYILVAAAFALTAGFSACGTAEKAAMSEGIIPPPPAAGARTVENLQTAFEGESNANVKYLAFAKKADEEGYLMVASLFRAAARAEEIHKNNHADVIKKMGAEPKAEIKPAEVKTTAENLKSALEGETYERDKMYPDFLAEARASNNRDAVRTFNLAKTAEAEHAKLYSEALANLDAWKGAKTTFFVCPTCGFTSKDALLEKCPVDFTPKNKFESIS